MNIAHGLRRALQINPNGLAIVYGDRRKNWREVGDRVARLAGAIRALGAEEGDRVAILSFNSDRYLELYLAAGWSGTVIVPLNIRWSPLENEDAMGNPHTGRNSRSRLTMQANTIWRAGYARREAATTRISAPEPGRAGMPGPIWLCRALLRAHLFKTCSA